MDWLTILAPVARLVDLHDCDRTPGTVWNTPPENRPGIESGIWLSVATELLEYLYSRDLEVNEAWVPLSGIFSSLATQHRISEPDVIFVASYLATPSRLTTLTRNKDTDELERHTTKKDTALIEWPRNTKARDRCRLTAAGNRAIQFSQSTNNWLYADNDAEKLLKAVEYGAFGDIPALAEKTVAQIRQFSKAITVLLERRDLEGLLEGFREHKDDYLAVLSGVQESVQAAHERFALAETIERFEIWEATHPNGFSAYTIIKALGDVLQAIERLSRRFQDLLSVLVSEKRNVIGSIPFDKVAVGLAFYPCADEIVKHCIAQLGPIFSEITMPSVVDFEGQLRRELADKPTMSPVFNNVAGEDIPSPLERFLTAYRSEIAATLNEGPLSLTDAVHRGWLELDELDTLPQLVGIYTTPEWLAIDSQTIEVSYVSGGLDMALPGGHRLAGDDILLRIGDIEPTLQGDTNGA